MQNNILNNRYELLQNIGQGSTSIVYKALDRFLNRYVAVKVLKEEFSNNQKFYEQFVKEAKAVGALQHDNIIKIFDFGIDDKISYIVMEYFNSINLKQYISKQMRFFSNKEIVDISYQIALALKEAHKYNIVHRDIKPQNILISNELKVKVTDFGIAKMPNDLIGDGTIVNDGNSMGTVHYSSPEQLRSGFVDYRTDIYSFGVVLYELSTNKLPYDSQNMITVALKHFSEDIVSPSKINRGLNPTIEKIITYCTKRKPELRFESIDDIIIILEEIKLNPDKNIDFELKMKYDDIYNTIHYDEEFQNNIEKNIRKDIDFEDSLNNLILDEQETKNVKSENLERLLYMTSDKKEYKNKEKKKNLFTISNIFIAIFGLILGVFIVSVIFYKPLANAKRNEPFVLESIENMNFIEAGNFLAKKGVFLDKVAIKYSDKVDENHIITQDPKSGTLIKAGQTVSVVVATKEKQNTVIVPNVKQKLISEANIILEKYKLKYEIVKKEENILPKGTIIDQSPKSENEVKEGTIIKLVVSDGLRERIVINPYVIGLTKDEAITKLNNQGLKNIIFKVKEDAPKTATVISQNIAAGAEIGISSKIVLTISPDPEEKDNLDKNDNDKSNEPKEPVKQDKPNESKEPVKQDKPNEPKEPVKQDKSNESKEPVKQDKPNEPKEPVKQDKPNEPKEPVKQDKPNEPKEPVKQDKPNESKESVKQDKPNESKEPVKQDKPNESSYSVKTYYVPLVGSNEEQNVKIVKIENGSEIVLYNKIHKKEEKKVVVNIKGSGKTILRFYVDGNLLNEKSEDF